MDYKKLIGDIDDLLIAHPSENVSKMYLRKAADAIKQLITHGVTVQEWISVDDRLPEETGRYLAAKKRIAPDEFGGNRTDIVILRFFVGDGFRMPTHIPDWINEEINEEVTHWMPLPSTEGLE